MYEDAQEIFEYLPIRRDKTENEYIDHLWQVFSVLDQTDTNARPFAVMPFHLLFMLSIQYKILRIASTHKQATDLFFTGVGGRDKDQLLSEQRSVFDMALIKERTIADIFQLINLSPKVIKIFKDLVDDRNNTFAHAKGGIGQDIEKKIKEYIDIIDNVQKCCLTINQQIVNRWIEEIEVDDSMEQFLEIHFLDSRLSPRDFGDTVGGLLKSEKLNFEQFEQVVNKGLELSYNQTIFEIKSITFSNDFDVIKKDFLYKTLKENNQEDTL